MLSNHASSLAKLVSSRGTSSPIASLISAVSCAQPYGIFIAPDIIALDTDSPKLTSLFSSAFSKIVLSFVASAKPFDPLGYNSIASSVACFISSFSRPSSILLSAELGLTGVSNILRPPIDLKSNSSNCSFNDFFLSSSAMTGPP